MRVLQRIWEAIFPPDYELHLSEVRAEMRHVRIAIREAKRRKGKIAHLYTRLGELNKKAVALEILLDCPDHKLAKACLVHPGANPASAKPRHGSPSFLGWGL